MAGTSEAVRLPSAEELIAPVRILDAEGRVVRIVSAAEFRRAHAGAQTSRVAPVAGRRHRDRN
jgi:hypothetical protein